MVLEQKKLYLLFKLEVCADGCGVGAMILVFAEQYENWDEIRAVSFICSGGLQCHSQEAELR